jgi:hypothetical protein
MRARTILTGLLFLAALAVLPGCGAQPVITTPGAVSTGTVTPTATIPATATAEPTKTVAPKPVKVDRSQDGKRYAEIHSVKKVGENYVFSIDIEQLFTGNQAYVEGKKDGFEVADDYYIRNSSKKLRSFSTKGNVAYVTHPDTSPGKNLYYHASDLYSWWKSGKGYNDFPDGSLKQTLYGQVRNSNGFFFNIKNGVITRIEFFWRP